MGVSKGEDFANSPHYFTGINLIESWRAFPVVPSVYLSPPPLILCLLPVFARVATILGWSSWFSPSSSGKEEEERASLDEEDKEYVG